MLMMRVLLGLVLLVLALRRWWWWKASMDSTTVVDIEAAVAAKPLVVQLDRTEGARDR